MGSAKTGDQPPGPYPACLADVKERLFDGCKTLIIVTVIVFG